jgi:tetratricopeptide (TPR) repeat protein
MTTLILLLALFAAPQPQFDSVFRDGLLALNRNDLPVARERLEAAAKLRPESGETWAALAQTYLKLQQPETADKAAEKAQSLAGKNLLVLRALLLYYSGRGQPNSVIEVARKAIALENRPDLHHTLAGAYLAVHQDAKAVAELREAVRLAPNEERYHFDLGQTLLKQQDFDGAARALEAGCKVLPKSAQLQLALGVAYYGQRRFPEAIERFLETIRLAPEVEQPYVFLGRILDHAGDRLPEIQQRFEAFRTRNPNNFMANFLSAKVLLAQPGSDSAQVEKRLRQSIAANDKFWESHFELGVLLSKNRKFADAEKELRQAADLNPKEAVPHYHLARVYDRLGKPELAAQERALHEKLVGPTDVK